LDDEISWMDALGLLAPSVPSGDQPILKNHTSAYNGPGGGQKVGPGGHLYLGAGRRRAGAGFYRRPKKKKKFSKAQKKEGNKLVKKVMLRDRRRRGTSLAKKLEDQLHIHPGFKGLRKGKAPAIPSLKRFIQSVQGKHKGKHKGKHNKVKKTFEFYKDLVKITAKPKGKHTGKANEAIKKRSAKIEQEKHGKERAAKMKALEGVSSRVIAGDKLQERAKKKGKKLDAAEGAEKKKAKAAGKAKRGYKELYHKFARFAKIARTAAQRALDIKAMAANRALEKKAAITRALAKTMSKTLSHNEPKLSCPKGQVKCTNKCKNRFTAAGCAAQCMLKGTCNQANEYSWCKYLCQGTCTEFCPGVCVANAGLCPK